MTRRQLARRRGEIAVKAALGGSILTGGLLWAYAMARMTGAVVVPALPLDEVAQVLTQIL